MVSTEVDKNAPRCKPLDLSRAWPCPACQALFLLLRTRGGDSSVPSWPLVLLFFSPGKVLIVPSSSLRPLLLDLAQASSCTCIRCLSCAVLDGLADIAKSQSQLLHVHSGGDVSRSPCQVLRFKGLFEKCFLVPGSHQGGLLLLFSCSFWLLVSSLGLQPLMIVFF